MSKGQFIAFRSFDLSSVLSKIKDIKPKRIKIITISNNIVEGLLLEENSYCRVQMLNLI